MILNNLYNFKNPVKHFLDIDALIFPADISSFDINNLSWVAPFSFRVKKNDFNYRTLKMPNILNFAAAYEHFKDLSDFERIQNMDPSHKRLSTNIETGDFVSGEYDRQLEDDFNSLCMYDILLKVDIKEYYGRIYTHLVDFQGKNERFLSNMNLGKTNGLIMGNYLSLYFAETNLKSISNDIEKEFTEANIDCQFSYFSDDFYFFCNRHDVESIIRIFDKGLESYELERNDSKREEWTYETFNNYNLVARYWKKLIAHCNVRFDKEKNDNKLYFINQIVYRMSSLQDDKLKKVFINNVFKTKYFRELDLEKFKVKDYDYHQLCFILRFSPEAMLYAVDKFISMTRFDKTRIHKFFQVRFKEALQKPFNEEQLYFYYALKVFDFIDILNESKDEVLKSNNQLLISYFLRDHLFEKEDIDRLKQYDHEENWFQNYHLIMYSDELKFDLENSINKYLIPKKATKVKQREAYMKFYKKNIELNNCIIRAIPGVTVEINDYLTKRIIESEAAFEAEVEEDVD